MVKTTVSTLTQVYVKIAIIISVLNSGQRHFCINLRCTGCIIDIYWYPGKKKMILASLKNYIELYFQYFMQQNPVSNVSQTTCLIFYKQSSV